MGVDRAGRDACSRGDRVDARGGVAALGELVEGGGDYALAGGQATRFRLLRRAVRHGRSESWFTIWRKVIREADLSPFQRWTTVDESALSFVTCHHELSSSPPPCCSPQPR